MLAAAVITSLVVLRLVVKRRPSDVRVSVQAAPLEYPLSYASPKHSAPITRLIASMHILLHAVLKGIGRMWMLWMLPAGASARLSPNLTDPALRRAQVDAPQVHVQHHSRLQSTVKGSILCAANEHHAWCIVRDCISGRSRGVVRSVESSKVLSSRGNNVLLEQSCSWNVGPLRGRSHFVHDVSIFEKQKRITFAMVQEDSMIKRFTGELHVKPHARGGAQTSTVQCCAMRALTPMSSLRFCHQHAPRCGRSKPHTFGAGWRLRIARHAKMSVCQRPGRPQRSSARLITAGARPAGGLMVLWCSRCLCTSVRSCPALTARTTVTTSPT